jgi:hypothetical protein
LIELPMPLNDSDKKIMFDLMGTAREITLEGTVTVDDVGSGNLYKYARDIVGLGVNSLIFGNQGLNGGQAGYIYIPESLNRGSSGITIRVYVNDAQIKSDAGNPNALDYSVTLVECNGTDSG